MAVVGVAMVIAGLIAIFDKVTTGSWGGQDEIDSTFVGSLILGVAQVDSSGEFVPGKRYVNGPGYSLRCDPYTEVDDPVDDPNTDAFTNCYVEKDNESLLSWNIRIKCSGAMGMFHTGSQVNAPADSLEYAKKVFRQAESKSIYSWFPQTTAPQC